MSKKRDKPGPSPGLTEEERREWWKRQRRRWVWEEGDVQIIKEGDGTRPEGATEVRTWGVKPFDL